ncbi:carboxypeptidase [Candidatus Marinamargulisbacteria bacterium SCGC AAA071-K20]|nr:carboxypeptidase [Candidatus Marinamargulisbacteria bacterium SCGC AAA071-K20]
MKKLFEKLNDIYKLKTTQSLLSWDQETQLPEGAIDFRSEQMAFLAKLQHQFHCSDSFKEELSKFVNCDTGECTDSLNSSDRRLIDCIYKDWKQSTALPEAFVEEYTKLCSKAQHVWQEAREKSNFKLFSPYLKRLVEMSKEKAKYLNPSNSAYDVLLDLYEEGLTVDTINPLFSKLREETVTLLKSVQQSKASFYDLGKHKYNTDQQWSFGLSVLEKMGYDFKRGRQDKSTHPFTIDISPSDVRITTRVDESKLMEALSSSIHEGGHGLYEQGLNTDFLGTPYCESVSLGIHESQSRIWEKVIGQSMPFWDHFYPKLGKCLPQLSDCTQDEFYRSINQVNPGFIRVEADELTYNLHIMIRYEIEQMIFNEGLSVDKLPEVWNEKVKDYLGLEVKNDKFGVLQDVHWSCGLFGYFPTYTMGNLYSVMLFEQLEKDIPDLRGYISKGDLGVVSEWSSEKIYTHGRRYSPPELIERITGSELSCDPFVSYLNRKYSKIYRL